ncbi:uncharacterized protein LOC135847940 [Planococcus citri]|uniref:uncharacterized protein LOC135847940 n=1 Tax=Planococcus citri TaxID=170843 RepID=UPI0031F8FA82
MAKPKSIAFAIFVIGCLTTQASCRTFEADQQRDPAENDDAFAKPITQKSVNPSENTTAENSEGEDESEKGLKSADNTSSVLTCLLFETGFACDRTCSLAGLIYGQPITSGICDDNNACKCSISSTESLENLWRKKFDSENVLREIRKNKTLSKKILDALKTPFRTPQQTVSDLKPLLNTKQFKSLRIKDKEAQKLLEADGKFDRSAVEKYVAKKIKPVKTTKEQNFKKTLKHVLRYSDESVFDRIHDEIRLSKNELLNETLDEYMKKNNIQRSPLDNAEHKESLIDILNAIVVDVLIKPSPKAPTTRRDSASDKKSSNAEPNKPDVLAHQSVGLSDDWWILHGFDKIAAFALEKGKKCWNAEGYYSVCLNKHGNKHLLSWRNEKDNVAIEIKISNKKEIKQVWSFPKIVVEINRNSDGTIDQEWKFEDSTEVIKDSKGKNHQTTWYGAENQEAVEKYKQLINIWCAENNYLSGGERNCVIY